MKETDWKGVAELVGIAAIVASLIFVALQMKQSQEVAIATQYQERAALTIETIVARSQIPGLVESTGARLKAEFDQYDSEGKSTGEIGNLWFAARLSLAAFDNAHFQWQAGYLSDEAWEMQNRTLRFLLLGEPMARFIVRERDLYRKSFQELCRELVAKTDSVATDPR